jgi:hypothetical protein
MRKKTQKGRKDRGAGTFNKHDPIPRAALSIAKKLYTLAKRYMRYWIMFIFFAAFSYVGCKLCGLGYGTKSQKHTQTHNFAVLGAGQYLWCFHVRMLPAC